MREITSITEFVEYVKESEEYDEIWIADSSSRDGWADVEWDDRANSAKQATDLQNEVNSTVNMHPNITVYRADLTTQRVRFTEEGR